MMTRASLDLRDESVSWLGVGNAAGVCLRAGAAAIPAFERLPLHGGLVGYQLPKLQARKLAIKAGDLLVFATDGISDDYASDLRREDSPQAIAAHTLEKHFKGNDDGLVLVACYLGEES